MSLTSYRAAPPHITCSNEEWPDRWLRPFPRMLTPLVSRTGNAGKRKSPAARSGISRHAGLAVWRGISKHRARSSRAAGSGGRTVRGNRSSQAPDDGCEHDCRSDDERAGVVERYHAHCGLSSCWPQKSDGLTIGHTPWPLSVTNGALTRQIPRTRFGSVPPNGKNQQQSLQAFIAPFPRARRPAGSARRRGGQSRAAGCGRACHRRSWCAVRRTGLDRQYRT